jgi:hypothetical protein
MNAPEISERVLRFIAESVDSVPQIEALLLLWQEPDKGWSVDDIAARIYVTRETAQSILRSLQVRQLATFDNPASSYRYSAAWDTSGTLMAEVAAVYRRQLVRVTTIIHSGASSSVRAFARAFDLKKDR